MSKFSLFSISIAIFLVNDNLSANLRDGFLDSAALFCQEKVRKKPSENRVKSINRSVGRKYASFE